MNSKSESRKRAFDSIALNVISLLVAIVVDFMPVESHPNVRCVVFEEKPPASLVEIQKWERESRLLLPADMRSFYLLSNGLSLTWSMFLRGETLPFGGLKINSLSTLKLLRVNSGQLRGKFTCGDQSESSDEEVEVTTLPRDLQTLVSQIPIGAPKLPPPKVPTFLNGVELDSACGYGRVALLFRRDDENFCGCGIWFQDLSSKWFFVAESFTDYFRLMILHLGIPRWQYAFTEVGLDHTTQQWFRILSPERLAIDLRARDRNVPEDEEDTEEDSSNDSVLCDTTPNSRQRRESDAAQSTLDLSQIEQFAVMARNAKSSPPRVRTDSGSAPRQSSAAHLKHHKIPSNSKSVTSSSDSQGTVNGSLPLKVAQPMSARPVENERSRIVAAGVANRPPSAVRNNRHFALAAGPGGSTSNFSGDMLRVHHQYPYFPPRSLTLTRRPQPPIPFRK